MFLSTLIILAITILFTVLYGTRGIEGSDTSYLRGFSYDLINGKKLKENIFFSFPFTLFFSSLIYLPMITGNVLFERFCHFFLIGLISFFSFSFLKKKEEEKQFRSPLFSSGDSSFKHFQLPRWYQLHNYCNNAWLSSTLSSSK